MLGVMILGGLFILGASLYIRVEKNEIRNNVADSYQRVIQDLLETENEYKQVQKRWWFKLGMWWDE